MSAEIGDILRERFGHDSLLPMQARIIDRVMGGGDALVVMPTGSGKSLCFQLPALALAGSDEGPGVTLVFSPLIALMEDQVQALRARGIRAGYINSTLGRKEREKRYRRLGEGAYEMIFATPERMHKPEFREALARVPGGVKLLAVDEAHCISKWGHDLRPAYQQIGEFRRLLGRDGKPPTTIALTATATARVRDDIREVIGRTGEEMPLFALPIERPNLELRACEVWDDGDKVDAIVRTSEEFAGTGIVYFALIRDLERYADLLRARVSNRRVEIYHGRLDPREKKRMSRLFVESRPGDGLLLLATNAFGMGVDKPDIRFIVHAQVPGSVEAYYQEVGRGGRDGEASRCELLFAQDDLAIQQQFIEWMNPPASLLLEAGYALERSVHADFDADELRLAIRGKVGGDGRFDYALIALEKLGVVEQTSVPGRFAFVRRLREGEVNEAEIDEKRRRDLTRLLEVVNMSREGDIQAFVSAYFDLGQ